MGNQTTLSSFIIFPFIRGLFPCYEELLAKRAIGVCLGLCDYRMYSTHDPTRRLHSVEEKERKTDLRFQCDEAIDLFNSFDADEKRFLCVCVFGRDRTPPSRFSIEHSYRPSAHSIVHSLYSQWRKSRPPMLMAIESANLFIIVPLFSKCVGQENNFLQKTWAPTRFLFLLCFALLCITLQNSTHIVDSRQSITSKGEYQIACIGLELLLLLLL